MYHRARLVRSIRALRRINPKPKRTRGIERAARDAEMFLHGTKMMLRRARTKMRRAGDNQLKDEAPTNANVFA